ncbi:hypothetical protein F4778DRAFT_738028 [Xylariomycetidae sp. FL2044]|nr:hypothetical protein F4778DRAFT_738028 [Xylariomycetidae sp. FL2044]
MGRLGPLTSLALGRSPYDDVVDGEGEADPREPEKQYDPAGRLVNPETKKIIKDLIRAHNEVMLVIGVAEPENAAANEVERTLTKNFRENELNWKTATEGIGAILVLLGLGSLQGIQKRALIYRKRADLPFLQLLYAERRSHSYAQLYLSGFPSLFLMQRLRAHTINASYGNNMWLRAALGYIRFHLVLFSTLQRLDLIDGSQWLPGIKFFIPFSSSSPFTAPPPLGGLSASSLFHWVGALGISIAPYALYYVVSTLRDNVAPPLVGYIYSCLPHPTEPPSPPRPQPPPTTAPRLPVPESPTLGAADREIRPAQNPELGLPTSLALDGQANGEVIPVGAIRRQSTFSSRAEEDYGTDEEDADIINATLISFDVDTSESTEPPTGVWSAELRPSFGGDARQQPKEAPVYASNELTKFPPRFAALIMGHMLADLLCAPLEALGLRAIARDFVRKNGLHAADILGLNIFEGFTWRGVFNITQLVASKFLVSAEIWALVTLVARQFYEPEGEYKEMHREEVQQSINGAG